MAYAAKAWQHRLAYWAIAKKLKETQRQVLIKTMGAYGTSPLQDLSVISNNPPIRFKLVEQSELRDKARGLIEDSKKDVFSRMLRSCKIEWNTATTGRYTYNLLPSVEECQMLSHMQDLDHGVVQLLTGYGPHKSYLMRFHRLETDRCEDCGETDEAVHPLLYCPAHEDLRNEIHTKAIEVRENPWNLYTLIRHKKTFEALKDSHTKSV